MVNYSGLRGAGAGYNGAVLNFNLLMMMMQQPKRAMRKMMTVKVKKALPYQSILLS